MIGSFMKISAQCLAATKKANQMLRTARKEMQSKTDDIAMLLGKSVVCPYLNSVYISQLCLNFVGWITAVLSHTQVC